MISNEGASSIAKNISLFLNLINLKINLRYNN